MTFEDLKGIKNLGLLSYNEIQEKLVAYVAYIEINTIANYAQSQFLYEVDISKDNFKFDKFCFLENGLIDGIRFCADGVFLFIFALEHNLVLTKSKYDLFEEIEMILPETEAVLKIRKIEQQI